MAAVTAVASDLLRDTRHHAARAYPACAQWLVWLELEEKAPRTVDDYERTFAELLRCNPELELVDFTPAELATFLRGKTEGRRRVCWSHLNSAFRWAYVQGLLETNPMDRVPRPRGRSRREIDVFTEADIERLCGLSTPDGQLMRLLVDTGIRKTEARMLRLAHVSLDHREVRVLGRRSGGGAKGDKDRTVPLTDAAYNAVRELVVLEGLDAGDFLWYSKPGGGDKVSRSSAIGNGTFHRWYERSLFAAGVAYRNPHTTRHTFATRLLRAGARLEGVKRLMGHASIQTTSDLYGHLDLEDVRADLALLEA